MTKLSNQALSTVQSKDPKTLFDYPEYLYQTRHHTALERSVFDSNTEYCNLGKTQQTKLYSFADANIEIKARGRDMRGMKDRDANVGFLCSTSSSLAYAELFTVMACISECCVLSQCEETRDGYLS